MINFSIIIALGTACANWGSGHLSGVNSVGLVFLAICAATEGYFTAVAKMTFDHKSLDSHRVEKIMELSERIRELEARACLEVATKK